MSLDISSDHVILTTMTKKQAHKKSFKEISDVNGRFCCDIPKPPSFLNRTTFNLLLVLVFTLGIFLRIHFLQVEKHHSKGDENFYVGYAKYLALEKDASVKVLISNYIDKKEWHIFPTPIRAGHIILSSLWMRLINRFDNVALLYMSCFFSILSLFLSYLFARRLFGEKIAFLSLILYTTSPLGLALSKRVLQEPTVYCFIILTLYLFYELLQNENIFLKVSFIVSFFTLILIKETSVMLAGFFLLYIFVEKVFFNHKLKILPAILSVVLPLMAAFFSYISLTGGLDRLISLVKIILLTPLTNEYVLKYQTGSFFRYFYDFFLLSPVTLVLSLIFMFFYFTGKNIKHRSIGYLVVLFITIYVFFSSFNKNIRAVMILDFPIRIFTVLFLADIFARFKNRKMALCVAAVVLIVFFDLLIFRKSFVVFDVYDPVTYNLQVAWQTWLRI